MLNINIFVKFVHLKNLAIALRGLKKHFTFSVFDRYGKPSNVKYPYHFLLQDASTNLLFQKLLHLHLLQSLTSGSFLLTQFGGHLMQSE